MRDHDGANDTDLRQPEADAPGASVQVHTPDREEGEKVGSRPANDHNDDHHENEAKAEVQVFVPWDDDDDAASADSRTERDRYHGDREGMREFHNHIYNCLIADVEVVDPREYDAAAAASRDKDSGHDGMQKIHFRR